MNIKETQKGKTEQCLSASVQTRDLTDVLSRKEKKNIYWGAAEEM